MRRGFRSCVVMAVLALVLAPALQSSARDAATAMTPGIDLGTLGGWHSSAVAVSGNLVVGWSDTKPGVDGTPHAFTYDLGEPAPEMHDLGTLGDQRWATSQATDVSGNIVVGDATVEGGQRHAFAYDVGAASPRMQDLGSLGGWDGRAVAVSGNLVVGFAATSNDSSNPQNHAFVYDLGEPSPHMRDLGTLGAGQSSEAVDVSGNIVVGNAATSTDPADPQNHAFVYDVGEPAPHLRDLGTLGGRESIARAVSGNVVVGTSSTNAGEEHAWAYDLSAPSPHMRDLGTLDGARSVAWSVSGSVVVGESSNHAFAYDLGAASPHMLDLGPGFARAVSGSIVVGCAWVSVDGGFQDQPFAYDLAAAAPAMRDLGGTPAVCAEAIDGSIAVGGGAYGEHNGHAWVWLLHAPTAVDDIATMSAGTQVTIDVLSNDQPNVFGNPPDPDTLEVTDTPDHGTATVDAGRIVYTPISAFTGTDTFAYRVCAPALPPPDCDTATVTVTVTGNETQGSTVAPTTVLPASELPRTGSTNLPLVAAGAGVCLLGGAFLAVGRRRTSSPNRSA